MKTVSYNNLWKLLIDNDLTKTEFREKVNISSVTLARLSKNECVSMETLLKICSFFKCDIKDIMEIKDEK